MKNIVGPIISMASSLLLGIPSKIRFKTKNTNPTPNAFPKIRIRFFTNCSRETTFVCSIPEKIYLIKVYIIIKKKLNTAITKPFLLCKSSQLVNKVYNSSTTARITAASAIKYTIRILLYSSSGSKKFRKDLIMITPPKINHLMFSLIL